MAKERAKFRFMDLDIWQDAIEVAGKLLRLYVLKSKKDGKFYVGCTGTCERVLLSIVMEM